MLGTSLFSQIKIHEQYGGVFPSLAKREHSKNLIPLLKDLLEKTGFSKSSDQKLSATSYKLSAILEREPELLKQFLEYIPAVKKPAIDAIAVTYGPGLEPALWVGINFARALSAVWDIPIIPVNHMEGHIYSVLLRKAGGEEFKVAGEKLEFPAIALLISGGHTELVLAKNWNKYEILGKTRDDAVGEAFDKVAEFWACPIPADRRFPSLRKKPGRPTFRNFLISRGRCSNPAIWIFLSPA